MKTVTGIRIGFLLVMIATSQAEANLAHTCYNTQPAYNNPNVPWFSPSSTVYIYISSATSCNGNNWTPMNATGLTQGIVEQGVQHAINIWNEESGSSIKLKYAGTTSACPVAAPAGAVVIYGRTDVCASSVSSAGVVLNPDGTYVGGTIELDKFSSLAYPNCSTPVVWTTSPNAARPYRIDMVAFLVHELGHAVYNIGHFDGGTTDCPNYASVMHTPNRALTNVDREVAQTRYQRRGAFLWKTHMSGLTSWYPAAQLWADSTPYNKRPVFRMGSMSNQYAWRVLGWVYGPSGTLPQPGGAGTLSTTQYQTGTNYWTLYGNTAGAMGHPVAIASKNGGGGIGPAEVLLAYLNINPNDPYSSETGQLCYRRSMDNGATFGAEVCATDTTNAWGLTAYYERFTNTFVIAYTSGMFPDNAGYLTVHTIPTSTSSVPEAVTYVTYGGSYIQSPHGPAVACGHFGSCLMAYETTASPAGLAWITFHVDFGTGAAIVDSSASQGWYIYDTPSVSYNCSDDTWRLVYATTSEAIYSYTMSASTPTSWSGTGDVYNNAATFISGGVLSARLEGTACYEYGWFVRYW